MTTSKVQERLKDIWAVKHKGNRTVKIQQDSQNKRTQGQSKHKDHGTVKTQGQQDSQNTKTTGQSKHRDNLITRKPAAFIS